MDLTEEVAQELNDQLTIIRSAAQAALERTGDDQDLATLLTDIQDAAQRCGWSVSAIQTPRKKEGTP